MSKKLLKGKVVSDKMTGVVIVVVDVPKKHPIYRKSLRNTKRFKAKNEVGAKIGDEVYIEESIPMSRHTKWIVKEVLTVHKEKK